MLEPVVRIRAPSPEDAARCKALLELAGLAPEEQLGWLAVRDADPDRVNDLLVEGGALGRTTAREQVGRLVAYLLDHQGDLPHRGHQIRQIVQRALGEAGLAARHQPRDERALCEAAAAELERLLAEGGAKLSWERFVAAFCAPR